MFIDNISSFCSHGPLNYSVPLITTLMAHKCFCCFTFYENGFAVCLYFKRDALCSLQDILSL